MTRHRYRRLFGRQSEAETDDELRIHLEMLAEDFVAGGMSPDDALQRAEMVMGDVSAARAETIAIDKRIARRESRLEKLAMLAGELRFAARSFGRDKGWTVLAVLTLAVGIGATSALFAVVNAVLIRPLPFAEPERLVSLSIATDGVDAATAPLPTFDAWKSGATGLSAIGAWRNTRTVLDGPGDPVEAAGRRVTAGYFPVLGVQPLRGRAFTPDDDLPGAPRVVILSEQAWRHIYERVGSIVGRPVLLDGDTATVIGVMPASFTTADGPQYWEPWSQQPQLPGVTLMVSVVGRLGPGATVASVLDELDALAPAELDGRGGDGVSPVVMPLRERLSSDEKPGLLMLFAAVTVLLLIACANVANLLLARAARRQREFAVRIALGASPWQLIRFVLGESTMLSLMGAAAGIVVAWGLLAAFVGISPPAIANADVGIDAAVVFFTIAAAVVTGLAFGMLPALHARKTDVHTLLANTTVRPARHRALMRRGLVVAELATALVLVTSAGLLIKSFVKLMSVPTGVDRGRVVVIPMQLSAARYDDGAAVRNYMRRAAAGLAAIAGVEAVAFSAVAPLGGSSMRRVVTAPDGRQGTPLDEIPVSLAWFRATGVELIDGRAFDSTDLAGAERVAVLSETAARAFGNGRPVTGELLPLGDETGAMIRVLGVARNVPQHGLDAAAPAIMYRPMEQGGGPDRFTTIIARVSDHPSRVIPAMREVMRGIDGSEPLPEMETLEDAVAEEVAPRWFLLTVLATFACIGALLAMVGLYGVMSYLVAERTNEIGIRAALGADESAIMRLILGECMVITAAGVALGLLGSLAAVRLLRAFLFQVSEYDPLIFAAAAVLLTATALAASIVPARRAAALDPVAALRA